MDSILLLTTNPLYCSSCKTNGKGSRRRTCSWICAKESLSPREIARYTPIDGNPLKTWFLHNYNVFVDDICQFVPIGLQLVQYALMEESSCAKDMINFFNWYIIRPLLWENQFSRSFHICFAESTSTKVMLIAISLIPSLRSTINHCITSSPSDILWIWRVWLHNGSINETDFILSYKNHGHQMAL